MSGFVGGAFAEDVCGEYDDQGVCTYIIPEHYLPPKEFSQEEIDEMKRKAVLITMQEGTFLIELFPEDAPNTVHNFLKLVESGYYDGIVFHRIIPGFMIQAGDPNTKDPEVDRSLWGQGDPGYTINAEFNTLQHDRGIVSMARGEHPDSAGSQFFIVVEDSNFLDGEYTAFGRLAPGLPQATNKITALATGDRDAPLDVSKATIIKATILDPFTSGGFDEPDRNSSIIKTTRVFTDDGKPTGEFTENYFNRLHQVSFELPFRWTISEGTGNYLNLVLEPSPYDHYVQEQVAASGFVPQILILSEEREPSKESAGVSTALFLIRGGEEPKISDNYVFENDRGGKAHIIISTQALQTPTETNQFKVIQLHFVNSESSYSIVYVNVPEWFRYEINAFVKTVETFEVMFDGKMQSINFGQEPIFKQLITIAREKPLPESLPPARIGGCLIATAAFGSELAPQVQQLRELRDNTVLQTESGSTFMVGFNQLYYSFSPIIADYERENPVFKEAVKLTITPLLTSLTLLQYVDINSEYEMLGYGTAVILLNIGMYFIAPAVLITKIRSFYKLQ